MAWTRACALALGVLSAALAGCGDDDAGGGGFCDRLRDKAMMCSEDGGASISVDSCRDDAPAACNDCISAACDEVLGCLISCSM
jgi:hypothetical protein